ncbi:hypothetical protein [Rhodanobacter hydrolyticus]|uniref:Uncharacterized protein n=1 Tax=Rhodanobacter hydrolyticus TaxID=2250595 RepID=A0ABW8J4C2_9GAMM
MTDTIELLEAIGSDASLRYAQADELNAVLKQTQASVELRVAVTLGDGAPLRDEFGLQQMPQTPQTHAPGHQDDDDGECDVPQRERHPDKAPSHPPAKKSH